MSSKKKSDTWQKWRLTTYGKGLPMGGYHPMDAALYEAWSAGWDAAIPESEVYKQEPVAWEQFHEHLAGPFYTAPPPWVGLTHEDVIFRKPSLDRGPDYERGFVEGMQYQTQSSVYKAINRLAPPPWVGLTDEEIKEIIGPWGDTPIKGYTRKLFDQIEAKLREKNEIRNP
jgi:hypothetical protein